VALLVKPQSPRRFAAEGAGVLGSTYTSKKARKDNLLRDNCALTSLIYRSFCISLRTTMATEEVEPTEPPEEVEQAAATEEVEPTEPPEEVEQAAATEEVEPTEPPEGAGQAAEAVEQPKDDHTTVEPSEGLPSERTEAEAQKVD
jgi:hypothetical protein